MRLCSYGYEYPGTVPTGRPCQYCAQLLTLLHTSTYYCSIGYLRSRLVRVDFKGQALSMALSVLLDDLDEKAEAYSYSVLQYSSSPKLSIQYGRY